MQKDNKTIKGNVNTFGRMNPRYNVESHDHNDTCIGAVISKGLKKKIKMSSVLIVVMRLP